LLLRIILKWSLEKRVGLSWLKVRFQDGFCDNSDESLGFIKVANPYTSWITTKCSSNKLYLVVPDLFKYTAHSSWSVYVFS
jgi:hypothetical protein